jgi:hypothetical protein
VNNTVRQVGGALGVAVLGGVLSAVYRDSVGPHLTVLPPDARARAAESIGATRAAAETLGGDGRAVVEAAHGSFVHAMHVTSLGSAFTALVGALVVLRWLPGRGAVPVGEVPAPRATTDQAATDRPSTDEAGTERASTREEIGAA